MHRPDDDRLAPVLPGESGGSAARPAPGRPSRRPWIAAALALPCIGLGHLYAGRPGVAIGLQGASLVLALVTSVALRAGPGATGAAVAAWSFLWLGQAFHAGRTARRTMNLPRTAASGPLALAAFFAATVVVPAVVVPWLRSGIAGTAHASSGSMVPTVLIGDVVVVASGKPGALRGAVVVHAPPAGSSHPDPLLKRVVAVGGEAVEIRDGALRVNEHPVVRRPGVASCTYANRAPGIGWRQESCTDFVEELEGRAYHVHCTPGLPCGDVVRQVVPAGHVFVAGDHRDHSADSRVYGPVPEDMILGEVRWVIFSIGPDGVRWGRIGAPVR
jgi:signal peptidase I